MQLPSTGDGAHRSASEFLCCLIKKEITPGSQIGVRSDAP